MSLRFRVRCGQALNAGSGEIAGDGGFSMTELLAVLAIASALIGLAGLQYANMMKRYNVEREIREMQADLLNARASAMTRNRAHFVVLTAGGYTTYEDTYDATAGAATPDGDGTLQATNDTVFLRKTLNVRYPIMWNGNAQINFNGRGIWDSSADSINPPKVICSNTSFKADYGCIKISETRIAIGEYRGGGCSDANCVIR